jgi:hypothetical protein
MDYGISNLDNIAWLAIGGSIGFIVSHILPYEYRRFREKRDEEKTWYESTRGDLEEARKTVFNQCIQPEIDFSNLQEAMREHSDKLTQRAEEAPDETAKKVIKTIAENCNGLSNIAKISREKSGTERWKTIVEILRRTGIDTLPREQLDEMINGAIELLAESNRPLRDSESGNRLTQKYPDIDDPEQRLREEIGIEDDDMTSAEVIENLMNLVDRISGDQIGEVQKDKIIDTHLNSALNWYFGEVAKEIDEVLNSGVLEP